MPGIYKPGEGSLELEEVAFGPGLAAPRMKAGGAKASAVVDLDPETFRPAGEGTDGKDPVARVAEKLAGSLAGILAAAIRDFQDQTAGGGRELEDSFRQQQEKLEVAARDLAELKRRLDELAEAVSKQEARSAAREYTHAETAAALAKVRHEMQELSASLTDRMNALFTRQELQQQALSDLEPAFSTISPRVNAVAERLDRQAQAIRSIVDAQTQRDTALDQLVEIFSRMKDSWSPVSIGAGAPL
ncbi:MAG: hypothetical protein HY236_09780 [Acidobacteria bacterium]|nr:hypothetical protein [Acidobacteriota bacterium]